MQQLEITAKVKKGPRTKSENKDTKREMIHETFAEYRNINDEIAQEMTKYSREKNEEKIENIIEENKSLKDFRRQSEM